MKEIYVIQTLEKGCIQAWTNKKAAWDFASGLVPESTTGSYKELCDTGSTTLTDVEKDETEIVSIPLEVRHRTTAEREALFSQEIDIGEPDA